MRVALLIALLTLPMPAAVRAADVETTLTLTRVESPGYIQVYASYEAALTPLPPVGTVWFDVSYDQGASWQNIAWGSPGASGLTSAVAYVEGPEGTRLVRARYDGEDGYLGSVSAAVPQIVARQPTTVEAFEILGPEQSPVIVPASSPITLRAAVRGASKDSTAGIVFEELVGEDWQELGTSGLSWRSGDLPYASVNIESLSQGPHTLRARFEGDDLRGPSSKTVSLTVGRTNVSVVLSAAPQAQANHPIWLLAAIQGELPAIPTTGTLSIREGSVVKATTTSYFLETTIPPMSVGTHTLVASYSGDGNYLPATSAPFVVTVVPDTVEATGVGLGATTFYPVVDGYRDTVAIKGKRLESIAVAISIYNSSGTRVRTGSVARGSGAYSYSWNGRNSAGSLVPAGKYKVVQTLTDAFGTKKSFTAYVNVSMKKLVTYTSYVTKSGSQLSAKGSFGSGSSVTVSTTAGYVKLTAGSNGQALAGWELVLPTATVYKSITFQVYAKAVRSVPPTWIAMQNFATCARGSGNWYDSCFDRWTSIGNATGSLAWYGTSGSVTNNRTGRYVRGMVSLSYGKAYVYKARVKVVYGILK